MNNWVTNYTVVVDLCYLTFSFLKLVGGKIEDFSGGGGSLFVNCRLYSEIFVVFLLSG